MSAYAPPPFAEECNFRSMHFMPPMSSNQKQSVDVFWDGTSMARNNRIKFQLTDTTEPVTAMYSLDSVREDGNALRRSQTVVVPDGSKLMDKLKELDETIVSTAVQNALLWFKKPQTEDQIRARYTPVLNEKGGKAVFSFKVKCPGHMVPTKLHLFEDVHDLHKVEADGGRIEDLQRNALLVPVVSTLGIWFMGGGNFGMSFQAEELIIGKAPPLPPLSSFRSTVPLVVKASTTDTLKDTFDELESEMKAEPPAPLREEDEAVELDDDEESA